MLTVIYKATPATSATGVRHGNNSLPSVQGSLATQDVSLDDAPFQIAPEEDVVMYNEPASSRSTREKHARSDDAVDDAPPAIKRRCAHR